MKNSLHAVYVLALFFLVGNFQAHAQDRVNQNLRGFSAINASSGVDVYLSQGSTESVEVEAEEESLKYLITEVDNNNTLVIKMDDSWKRWFKEMEPVKVYVTFTNLDRIQLSGGTDVMGQGELEFENLQISSSGGSDIRLNLRVNELEVNSSGGADVVLKGNAAYLKGSASGGSDIKAQELDTEVAEINSSGASDVHVKVSRALKASASGASDIVYYGNPKEVEISTSGASDITKR